MSEGKRISRYPRIQKAYREIAMKAVEATGTIDGDGILSLDKPLPISTEQRVRVIVLIVDGEDGQTATSSETDPDDTPVEEIKASLRRSLEQAKRGERIPLAQMWDGVDADE